MLHRDSKQALSRDHHTSATLEDAQHAPQSSLLVVLSLLPVTSHTRIHSTHFMTVGMTPSSLS